MSTEESWDQGLSAGIWYSSTRSPQTSVWKLAAAMGTVAGHFSHFKPVCSLKGTILAYVKMPYVLLVGEANISINGSMFNVSCLNCILTNCMSQMDNCIHVMV